MNEPARPTGPSRRMRPIPLTAALGLLVLTLAGFRGGCALPFEDSTLEAYGVAVVPSLPQILAVLGRPDEPFVMTNLLVFKDQATGEGFEGLTGAEAYQIYSDGLVDAQAELGSRLIFTGAVRTQVVGSSEPAFQLIALLEYASPTSFFTFAQSPGDAPEARTAGLLGQWLVASTTLEEGEPSSSPRPARRFGHAFSGRRGPCPPGAIDWEDHDILSGLSPEQICRLLDGPADEPVAIVELLRFADESGELYQPYREALASAADRMGGELVWRGSLDIQALGTATPSFDELVVTRYPSPAAYLSVLMSPRVRSASSSRAEGLEVHWIYTATETTSDAF